MAQSFCQRHPDTIVASVGCFDRVIFKGYAVLGTGVRIYYDDMPQRLDGKKAA